MALSINSNIQSLNAQRQLVKSGDDLSTAMERLSSGKRINSAADDAAGLAISNRMTSQVNGLNRAVSNANDGISMIQTAEGALDESTNILQRMRELSIQSANGIYGDGDRATLDAEVQQLVAELDRISASTSFNGVNLLDGGLNDVKLQVGAEANQTVSFSIGAMNADSLGLGSTSSDMSGADLASGVSIGDGDVKINGQGLSSFTGTANNANLQTLIDDINTSIDGVTAEGFNVVEAASVGTGVISAAGLDLTLVDVNGGASTTYTVGGTSSLDELAAAINAKTGGSIDASIDDNGKLVLSNTTGGAITVNDKSTGNLSGLTDATFQGNLSLKSDDGSAITITKGANGTDTDLKNLGFVATTAAGELTGNAAGTGALAAGDLLINGTDVGAVTSAAGLMGKVDAINAVSDTTGVTASIVSEASFTVDTAATAVEAVISGTTSIASNQAAINITINGVSVYSQASNQAATTVDVDTMLANINSTTSSHGATAYKDGDGELHVFSSQPLNISSGATEQAMFGAAEVGSLAPSAVGSTATISINNVDVTITDETDIDQIVSDINGQQSNTGVRASIDDNGQLKLDSTSTVSIQLSDHNESMKLANALGMSALVVDGDNDNALADSVVTISPRIKLDSDNGTPISIDVKDAAAETATGFVDSNTDLSSTVTGSSLSSISISTQTGANNAIDSIDQALETINETRSQLGAVSNRLDFTVSNLMNVSENTAAARSRIVDADFAAETASLSRNQVMQQAASAMLAQANSAPQQVLSLLR